MKYLIVVSVNLWEYGDGILFLYFLGLGFRVWVGRFKKVELILFENVCLKFKG